MDSWRAVARKLEAKLAEDEGGRKTLLDELEANIRGSNIVAEQVVSGAALGYCLFAPHRDSGLPLVAHVAQYGTAGTFGPRLLSSLSKFGQTLGPDDVEALCDIVGRFAEGRPGVVPATAFPPFLVAPPNHQHHGTWPTSGAHTGNLSCVFTRIVKRTLKRHGWAMALATTRSNRLGETQLTTFIRRIPPLELLRSFMDHVPGAQKAANERNHKDGSTPAHLCVRLDLTEHLQVLVDLGGADLHIKDGEGRTVLDLAETLEATDTLKLLAGLGWLGGPREKTAELKAAHGNVDFSHVGFRRFPGIYLPTDAPGGVPAMQTEEVLMSYMKSEAPQLLTTAGRFPPTILPPLEWSHGGGAATCPYPEGTWCAWGWSAENRVAMNGVIHALTELAREDGTPAGLKIACFPDLQFGRGLLPSTAVDLVVMGFDLETGAHAVLLVEVSSNTSVRDVVKREPRRPRVLNNLGECIRAIERDLSIRASPKWVIPCLALPLCPRTDEGMARGDAEEARLKGQWDAFVERASAFDDPGLRACLEFRPRLLARPTLKSPDRLKSFLRDELLTAMTASVSKDMSSDSSLDDPDSDDGDEMRRRAVLVLAWFLLHAVGIPMPRIPGFSVQYESDFGRGQPWALLTRAQLKAYKLAPGWHPGSDLPLLVMGGAGTGKTFLAVQKLIKCEREGLINRGQAAVFLTNAKNTALVKLVTAQLEMAGAKFIRVMGLIVPPEAKAGGQTKDLLLAHLHQAVLDKACFVVLDQLEDFYSDNDVADDSLATQQDSLLSSLLGLDYFQLFWIIVNPFDVPEAHHEELLAHLDSSSSEGMKRDKYSRVLVLDKRIGNPLLLGVLFDRMEAMTSSSSLPMSLVPGPVAGTLSSTHGWAPNIFWEYFRNEHESCWRLARVLHDLRRWADVPNKSLLVVQTARERDAGLQSLLLLTLDQYLISEFYGELKAPLLVRAPWVGDVKNTLRDDDELEAVRKYFEGALLLPPSADTSQKPTMADLPTSSAHLRLQTRFRGLVHKYAVMGQWPGAPGDLSNSVAFQAALSLVNRLVCISTEVAMNELTEVLRSKKRTSYAPGDQLRNLILRHRCISLLNMDEAQGYKADTVVVWDHAMGGNKASRLLDVHVYVKMLALAKVHAVLIAPKESKALLERCVVGPFRIWPSFPPAFGQTNGTLNEYMKRDLPNLPGMSKSLLLVVPPVLDTAHPAYPTGIAQLLEEMVPTLRKLHHESDPHLDIACFHNLRYSCSRNTDRSRTSCEGDLSVVIMCFNKATKAYMVAVFQAEEPEEHPHQRIRVCVPLTNRPVWRSSSGRGGDSGSAGRADKKSLADTIQPCISLADGDDNEDKLGQKWEAFLWSAAQCRDAREVAADSGFRQTMDKSTWVDLEQLMGGRQKDWLQNFLAAVSDNADKSDSFHHARTHAYQAVLDWCMMHCTGVMVKHISKGIDDTSWAITAQSALVGTPAAAAAAASSPSSEPPRPPPETSDDASLGTGSRLLIVGGGGTGKTLLALQKLINCEKESGSINATNRGLFLTHEKNRALIVQVRRLLEKNQTRFIQVRAFPSNQRGGETRGDATDLKSFLEAILKDNKDIRFVVFDQLEDVMNVPSSDTPQPQQQQQLPDPSAIITSVMSVKGFRMLWATVNPFDAPGPECHGHLWSYLADPDNASSILLLDTRVRNTTEIGALLERADAAAVSLPPFLIAEPACSSSWVLRVGTAGSGATPRTTALLPLWGVPVFAEPFLLEPGGRHRTLVEVLHHLILYLGVREEDILVVDSGEYSKQQQARPLPYLVDDKQTESALVKKFCEPRNQRVPSMAPLLVRATWVGHIEDCLSEEELQETKRRVVGDSPPITSLGIASPSVALDDADSKLQAVQGRSWLQHLEQCLEKYERGEGPWSPDDELFDSPALQATLSLIRRFVMWTQKNTATLPPPPPTADPVPPKIRNPYKFVMELEQAVTDASSTLKLRNLILKNRCISLLDGGQVGGAEANVIIFRDSAQHFATDRGHQFDQAFAARLLSRAKIIAIITTENRKTVFGSLDTLYPE